MAYNEHLIEKFQSEHYPAGGGNRRRYEELYAAPGFGLEDEDNQKPIIMQARTLRRPNIDQLKRVVNYAQRFSDYNDKTSITRIGNTRFDDFELFEQLSGEIFEQCFAEVVDEVESINSELTTNLVKGEMMSNHQRPDDFSRLSRFQLILSDRSRQQQQHQTVTGRTSLSSARSSSFMTSPTRTVSISTSHRRQAGRRQGLDEQEQQESIHSYNDDSFISSPT